MVIPHSEYFDFNIDDVDIINKLRKYLRVGDPGWNGKLALIAYQRRHYGHPHKFDLYNDVPNYFDARTRLRIQN